MTHMVQLTWGDALVLKVHRSRVGLKPFVDAIQAAVGKNIGTRPTFAKLYDARDVESMSDIEKYRAWLLLTAMGLDPDDWGIRADVVPRAHDVEYLRTVLADLVAELVRHQGLDRPISDVRPILQRMGHPADNSHAAGRDTHRSAAPALAA